MPGKIFTAKVCVVGDVSVGKTSLLLKYSKNTFMDNYKPTLGADFIIKEEKLPNDDQFHLYLWDLAGNPSFAILRQYYMHGANGAVICFDLGNPASFESVDTWLKDVIRIKPDRIPIILVGTKVDAPQKVDEDVIQAFAKEKGLPFIKTSSKEGENIRDVFMLMIQRILEASGST